MEDLPEPKQKLNDLLRIASEKHGRELVRFERDEANRRLRVADLTDDFSPLLDLPAFRRFHDETRLLLQQHGWL